MAASSLPPTYFEQGTILLRYLFPEIDPSFLSLVFYDEGNRDSFPQAYNDLCAIIYKKTTNPLICDSGKPSVLMQSFKGPITHQDYKMQSLGIVVTDSRLITDIAQITDGPLMYLGGRQLNKAIPLPNIECECCYEDLAAPGHLELTCLAGHRFCTTCVKNHVEECMFGQNNYHLIQCIRMETGGEAACRAEFPDHALRLALTENPRVQEQLFRLRDNKNESKATPPLDAQAATDSVATTSVQSQDLHHVVAERMTKIILRYCPGCTKPLQKVGGCNTLTCPHCHVSSCYVCRKSLSFFNMVHSCQSYTTAEQDDRRHRDQLLEEMKKEAASTGDSAAAALVMAELDKLGFEEKIPDEPLEYRLLTGLVLILVVAVCFPSVKMRIWRSLKNLLHCNLACEKIRTVLWGLTEKQETPQCRMSAWWTPECRDLSVQWLTSFKEAQGMK